MKMFIVFAAIIALAVAAPAAPTDYKDISVVKAGIDHIDTTGYKFEYEQSDGVVRKEEGIIKNPGTEQEALEVRGSITWTAADGEVYTLNFVADENGYRPEGVHIPHL